MPENRTGEATPPVLPVDVAPHGGFGDVRTDPSQGACGVHAYPCTHPGVDLMAPKGTVVHAPHAGWIWVSQPWGQLAPFGGYGPSIVLIAHDDSAAAAPNASQGITAATTWSLLAHLDPTNLRYRHEWQELMFPSESAVKEFGSGVHTGQPASVWKLLSQGVDGGNWRASTGGHASPDDVAAGFDGGPAWRELFSEARYVHAGDWVGKVGDARHVHWEIRSAPLGPPVGVRAAPFTWLAQFGTTDWAQAQPPKNWAVAPKDEGDGGGLATLAKVGLVVWGLSELL